jgi:hypothetical protein
MLRQTLQSRLRQDLDISVAELYDSLLLQQFHFLEQRLAHGASVMAISMYFTAALFGFVILGRGQAGNAAQLK